MILMKKAIELQFKMLFVLLMMVAGVVEMWGGTTTYHIINLGRLDDGGRLTDTRTEALKFTITSTTSTLQVPDQYKSPLAKNWKYYSANQVNFNTTTKECTFKVSEPTLVEGQTLSSNSDIYVTYEIDENAFSTLNLYDGGICLIKQGNNYLIPGHWKNDPNTSFASSTTVPTSNQYYWQFNIADPYQITIQSKSTTMVGDKKNISVLNWFLSKSDSFNDIRLKNSLSEAKNFKVWAFALLNGSENKYRLVVADGYSETANDTDGNGHGYLGQPADKKSRYSQYYKDINNDKIKEYVNIDLDIIPVTYNYTFNIVDNEGNVAIKSSPVAQYVGKKLSSYTDIPEAIRSPYLKDETITFYTFSGNYSSTQIIDDNKISTIPLAENANIYVRYTNNHLDEKFLHLAGSRILNFKLNNEYVYDNSGTLALENNEANTGNTSHLWNVMGRDPYAVKIRNVGNITHFFQFATPSTLSLGDGTGNSRFILMAGKDPKNDGQVELMAATGGTDQYRIGITDNNLTISTAAAGTESLQVELLEKKAMVKMRIIDKSGKIIVSEDNYETSRLAVPDQWMCPLVSEYHYWSTATQTGDVYTTSNPIVNVTDVGSGGTIYVTYDVGNTIDLTGSKTYLLRFHDGEEFYQEDGSDGVMETKRKAYYPYNNGDFNLYVYGQERWHQQLADGANQRTRWLWRIVSNQDGTDLTGEQVDPYHVIIKSRQNQEIKLNDVKYEGSTYLRTYKPTGHGQVVTGTAYKNTATNPAYPNAVPTDQPTEYMILGKSINELKLVTVQEIEDGTTTERRTVNSFEMYWKNNPTARDILNDVNKGVGTHEEVDYELSPEQKAVLTGKGWHTYQCWAYSAPWDNQSTGGKTLKNGNHWFQTISMGEGEFNFEEVELAPVLILLDKHGWEVVRILLPSGPDDLNRQVRYDAIHKYNSPMVKAYHYYKTADKVDGYHKYNVNLDSYATDTNGDEYTSDELGVLKDGKGNLPDYETQALDAKNNERDWYVTYDVKDEYVNTFPGASSESVLPNASYLLKVGTQFLKTENGNTISTFAESTEENDKEQWFLKPNFNIDREMGYKYQGEAGAQDGAMTKAQMDADNYANGRNGFDPYNVQILNKAYQSHYLTANTSGSSLSGGAWTGTTNALSLEPQSIRQENVESYDQCELNITNATFMLVGENSGSWLLMPRFDNQHVMDENTDIVFSSYNATANPGVQFRKFALAVIIHSSDEINTMDGYYKLASDFTFTAGFNSLGTDSDPFTGTIDGQLFPIRGTLGKSLVAYANGAIIRNVVFENVNITEGNNEGHTGAICQKADGASRIYNCGILAGSVSGSQNVGGLVGLLDGSSRVINCFSYADVVGGTNTGGIVGWNNFASTNSNLKTMVMNCMFYGNITAGNKAPIYNGETISNQGETGLSNFNYFYADADYAKNGQINTYNCALGAEKRFLQRFEFYRHLLNSHRELAAWYVTGYTRDADQIAKWVLDPSSIGTANEFPILRPWGYYPSVVNIDAEHVNDDQPRNQGGRLGTLKVNIEMGTGGARFGAPEGANITTDELKLNITDKDPDHFNFNYYKVQLPYYSEVGTGNYTKASASDETGRVVTGWKITSITNGTAGTFTSTGSDVTLDENGDPQTMPYNFADRYCKNKDLYGEGGSNRIFNQGAYWDVPEGVTEITIQPYWAKAVYLADEYADVVYNYDQDAPATVMTIPYNVTLAEQSSSVNGQTVYHSLTDAVNHLGSDASHTVYDYAVVLVGNYHFYSPEKGTDLSGNLPYTVTAIDKDGDCEPDYSFMLRFDGRTLIHPVRYDFLNLVGLGMAQKVKDGTGTYNFGIMQPKNWFEVTNTALFRVTQFEYSPGSRTKSPIILQGGVIEQWVSAHENPGERVSYFHVGGNVWFKEFHLGIHQDNDFCTPHPPVSVTGGDYGQFTLTGLYRAVSSSKNDNAECYINGGRFTMVAGTGMEGIGDATNHTNGNIFWQIDHADITDFYGGGMNAANPAQGNIRTIIRNSYVGNFYGGPKFGNMESGRTVKTTATDCNFGFFYGAGYGGNSYSRFTPQNTNNIDGDYGENKWNSFVNNNFKHNYRSDYGGVETQIDYQYIPMSNNYQNVARLWVECVKFSLAKTHGVTSELTGCTITNNFYGGGRLGKVEGDVVSKLTNCKVGGNVYGAGYSATLEDVEVMNTGGFKKAPKYDPQSGVFQEPEFPDAVTYTWEYSATEVTNTTTAILTDDTNNKHILYTHEDIRKEQYNLGSVEGNVTLEINGTADSPNGTTIGTSGDATTGYVYGGGEESAVKNNPSSEDPAQVTVTLKGKTTVLGSVFGGGNKGLVQGSTKVEIKE